MLKRILMLAITFVTLSGAFVLADAAVVNAQAAPSTTDANKTAACEGLALTGTTCDSTTSSSGVSDTIKLVINVLSLVVGVAAVIMIIIGGLKYILSQGEGSNTASAKNTILYAIVGLVIVALAQVIVRFVINKTPNAPCPTGQTRQTDGTCA